MSTKIATACVKGSAREVSVKLRDEVRKQLGDERPALLLVFASTAQPLEEIAASITHDFPDVPLLGASTAGEFTETGDAKSATSIFAVAGEYRVFTGFGGGLKADPEKAVASALDGLPREVRGFPHVTAILLLDPLAGNGEEATLIAASMLGEGVPLAGGAAGDDLKMQTTKIACGARVASDALSVALVFSKKPLGLGVCHGHRPLSPALKVTGAEGNVVRTIEGEPAWEVWRRHTRERAKTHGLDVDAMPQADEGGYLLRYEAGLANGKEYKIRAPLSRDAQGAIHFACGIPEGSVIRITESVPERQIESAREAARRARAQLDGPASGALVFDCICRNLILGDAFVGAVKQIASELGDVRIAGFETYGEIALEAGDMSGFHNTTTVVLAFPS